MNSDEIQRIDSLRALTAAVARLDRQAPADVAFHARVALGGNFSTHFLSGALRLMLRERGIEATVFEAPFDQWEPMLLDPASPLAAFRPDVTVLVLTRRGAPDNLPARAEAAASGRTVVVWTEPVDGETSLGPVWEQMAPDPWFAARYWETAALPFHPDLTPRVAKFA